MALGDAVVLEVDDARSGHLNRAEDSHHFEYAIVETGSDEAVVLFVTAPKVGAAHETGDVEDDDALKTG